MKTCTSCGKSKELDDFPPDEGNRDGHGARCLACSLQAQQKIRANLESTKGGRARRSSQTVLGEGLSVKRPEHNDKSRFDEPAIARWRAELEARRQAGIPDQDVDLREPVEETRPRTGFRFKRLAIIVSVVLLIALLGDLAYVGLRLRSNLSSAESSLSQGRKAIADSDLQRARNEFNGALRNARNAHGLEGHPALRTVRVLPWISSDARAVSVLASVAEIASLAGLEVTELYDRLEVGSGSELVGALFQDGRVNLDSVALASQTVSQLVASLSRASTLANEDVEPHFGTLAAGLNRVRSEVSQALGTLRRAETLLAAAPSLFAEGARSRYLLVIQNPSQSRSSGGTIDYYGILSATDGRLRLSPVLPISTLEDAAPADSWSLINRSVDFPEVARAIIERVADDTGHRLDGVIATDSFVLEYMAKATGPVRAPGLDFAIGPNNAAKVLMHDVFEDFEGRADERDLYVAEIIEKIWASVTKGVGDPSVLLRALNRSAREQHLKVYVSDPRSEAAIDDLELSGDPTVFGPWVQTIAQNSLSSSKVDFFLRRNIDTHVSFDEGAARVKTTTTIENRAPDGPPSTVLGFGSRPGRALLSLQMLLPEGAVHIFFNDQTGDTTESVGGRPLAITRVAIPPGEKRKVILNYELPPADLHSTFELVLLPAPIAFPDRASLHVLAPEGFCVNSCEDPSPGRWDRTMTLVEPLTVRTRLVPAD